MRSSAGDREVEECQHLGDWVVDACDRLAQDVIDPDRPDSLCGKEIRRRTGARQAVSTPIDRLHGLESRRP